MKLFEKTVHDFGTVSKGTKLEAKFKYLGTTPITVGNIVTTCGCTSKAYNALEQEITLTLDSTHVGQKTTNILVLSEILTLKANIIE